MKKIGQKKDIKMKKEEEVMERVEKKKEGKKY